jgi:hypothetical protein
MPPKFEGQQIKRIFTPVNSIATAESSKVVQFYGQYIHLGKRFQANLVLYTRFRIVSFRFNQAIPFVTSESSSASLLRTFTREQKHCSFAQRPEVLSHSDTGSILSGTFYEAVSKSFNAVISSDILSIVELSNVSTANSWSGVRLPNLRRRRAHSDRAMSCISSNATSLRSGSAPSRIWSKLGLNSENFTLDN